MKQRLQCPFDAAHSARMVESRDQNGVSYGRLVAWCFDCRAELPPASSLTLVPLTTDELAIFKAAEQRERTEKARAAAARKAATSGQWSVQPTEDQRRRDAEMRLKWGKGAKPAQLAMTYSLSLNRVYQILNGRRRSA